MGRHNNHDSRLILQADMHEICQLSPRSVQGTGPQAGLPCPKARGKASPSRTVHGSNKERCPRAAAAALGTRYLPGITFSGGLVPGGLIERMNAMIFQSSSEVLMENTIAGSARARVHTW